MLQNNKKPEPLLVKGGSEDAKLAAKHKLAEAFTIANLVHEGNLVCPECNTFKKGKVSFKTSQTTNVPYWKCYKCGERGDAISILQKKYNITFYEAVNELLGKTNNIDKSQNVHVNIPIMTQTTNSIIDVEVYNAVQKLGNVSKAADYYGLWHIDREVVQNSGTVYLENCTEIHSELLRKYGRERLLKCGLMIVDKKGKDFFLFNDDYPVLEPHTAPNGNILGMQFRPSFQRMLRVKEHKNWKMKWSNITDSKGEILDPAKAYSIAYGINPEKAGAKIPYVTPFLSLKGAGPDSLVGCGLHNIAPLKTSETIYIVEGFKDMLAALSMGAYAYAIPGAGVVPPEKVCKILQNHKVVITLDSDKAGDEGSIKVHEWLASKNVKSVIKRNPRGNMDITDILVERNAHAGCECITCVEWRATKTQASPDCKCLTCTTI